MIRGSSAGVPPNYKYENTDKAATHVDQDPDVHAVQFENMYKVVL